MSHPDPAKITDLEGVVVVPLRTPTLPPATHTNTVLIGREQLWVVDPATPDSAERARLLALLDDHVQSGRMPVGIVLTHHHQDHVGAAMWLHRERGWPIYAHASTRALLDGRLDVHETVEDGDILAGSAHVEDQWQVLHTPGHASGHIVLWQAERGALIGGDMVAATGTIIIEPPDGHMATYISQLKRLAALEPKWLVPAHGAVITEPVAHLEHYVSHRLAREDRVVAALTVAPSALADVTVRSYPDVPSVLHPMAERSCLAHLLKLQEEGRATEGQGGWLLCREEA